MLPLETGAKKTSVPSARVTRSADSSRDTRTDTPAATAWRCGFAASSKGVTAGTVICSPATNRARVEAFQQRRRGVKSLGERFDGRGGPEPREAAAASMSGGIRPTQAPWATLLKPR